MHACSTYYIPQKGTNYACIHMHTYIYTCIHTHTYIHTHMHTYIYTYTHAHTHTYTHTHAKIHSHIHACTGHEVEHERPSTKRVLIELFDYHREVQR